MTSIASVETSLAQSSGARSQATPEDISVTRLLDRIEALQRRGELQEASRLLDEATRLLEQKSGLDQRPPSAEVTPPPADKAVEETPPVAPVSESPAVASQPQPESAPTQETAEPAAADAGPAPQDLMLPLIDMEPREAPAKRVEAEPDGAPADVRESLVQPPAPAAAPPPPAPASTRQSEQMEPAARPQQEKSAANTQTHEAPRVEATAPAPQGRRASLGNESSAPAPAARMDPATKLLIDQAQSRRQLGDILGARAFLERASRSGNATALRMLAQTYDARALAEWGARGVVPDDQRAQRLYDLAKRGEEATQVNQRAN